MKGYNFTEQRMLLEVDDITPYLEHKKIDTLSLWNDFDNN